MTKAVCLVFVLAGFSHAAWAQCNDFIRKSTDLLCAAPTLTGLCVAVSNHDSKGMLQLGLNSVTTLMANYMLEASIRKERPDGTGHHAFPSTHAALAFDGSTFLMRRYGWKWGVPAYVVSAYVAWGRVYADRHDVWDVLGGAVLGTGCAFIYTRPFARNTNLSIAPAIVDGAKGVYVCMKF